ncbi:sigma-70 family RNA polymerase sigma factor [Herbiconiux sp.]|jgi:RNA polymerase sigma-B factor|uniref:sigma-70 family RNA polymerase sigma factor n=1 Tax=Herbiconiux sp. TaxID=1871186 RepID=UPI0025BC9CEC|nr:sigma-70 family RNA polymerase sigma factor [Herbiconiux sp.]
MTEYPDPEALVVEHLSLADAVARRFFRHDRARDEDLVQVARIGLLKAARRFDPEKGDTFSAFAVPTMAGEIKRHLRDLGWFVRPPRSVQELRARVAEATSRLTQELGRAPSLAELTLDLGESAAAVVEARACQQHLYPSSLDVPIGDSHGATLADIIPDAADEVERADLVVMLWSVLRTLPARERRVIQLRFFEDRTQQEIAVELGVTQMQVSRILTKTLALLRDRIVHGAPRVHGAGAA